MKSTQELENQIRQSDTPAVLAGEEYDMPSLAAHLKELLDGRNTTIQNIILRCNLDRSYGYQMFNGTRRPTRDFLLRLALVLQLSETEAQRLLKVAGRPPLYARNRRDAAVLYGLTHGLSDEQTDALLCSLGEEALA